VSLQNPTNIFGQVVIKERIEITPSELNLQIGSDNISAISHTVRIDLEWDRPDIEGTVYMFQPFSEGTGWTFGGSASLTVNNIVAPILMRFIYKVNPKLGEPALVSFKMYIDGVLTRTGSTTMSGG